MSRTAKKVLQSIGNKYHLIGFLIAIFLFLFVTLITIRKTSQLNNSDKIIQHTYDIKLLTEEILVDLLTVESGKRAFMLAGDTNFIKPYYYSKEAIKLKIENLRTLVSDNAIETRKVNQLDSLVNVRYILFDKVVKEIKETHNYRYTNAEIEEGKLIMDLTRTKIEQIKQHENALLQKRKIESQNLKNNAPIYLLLANMLSLIVIIFAYNKISRNFTRSQKMANKFNLSNQTLLQSQRIGNIGQWILNLQHGALTINEQHFKQLGYDNEQRDWTIGDYFGKVHPDDRHLVSVDDLHNMGIEETRQLMFRMETKNGKYAYLKTQLKRVQNNEGEDLIIGVVIDETANIKIQIELQKRNESLIQLNQELSSFNYISSHDLQEPLRKIQMFISRLVADEKNQLSEKGNEYFGKIRESASRMQMLIKDLLAYSGLNKTQQAFEPVDLNTILERVQEEWGQWMEERKVKLTIDELPIVYGVPFLLQTLFSNLMNNAIKYSSNEKVPEIKVSYNIVDRKTEESEDRLRFHQITIADNGIGFDKEFSEKIFELFQRLHERQQYPGTGIGLAICKKIVEVHQGIIYASGQLGQGATFTIELPVHKV